MDILEKALAPVLGDGMVLFLAASAAFVVVVAKQYRESSDVKGSRRATDWFSRLQMYASVVLSMFALYFTWMLLRLGKKPDFLVPTLVVLAVLGLGLVLLHIAKMRPKPRDLGIDDAGFATEVELSKASAKDVSNSGN